MIRNAKRRHILDNIASSSPADVWKFLGTLGIGRSRRLDIPNIIQLDDLNRHFSTSSVIDPLTKNQTLAYLSGLRRPDVVPFQLFPVAPSEIRKVILSIKSNAVGYDNICRRMIITILDCLLPAIYHIINFSLDSGEFPFLWRRAYVRALPKIPDPSVPNHFRPISILPFLSKVLEICVHKQLSRFIFNNSLISPFQSGFRPGHSTISALLKVTGDIRVGLEESKITILVLVDFSNAFNTVCHDILLSILSHLNVSKGALDWFSSYLQGRQQSVRNDELSSNWCNLESGVPQGGVLSPLLFSIFINFLTPELRCAFHLYADDLQLYAQTDVDHISDAITKLNNDLKSIKNWSDRFGLAVNPTKCQALIVGSHRNMSKISNFKLPPVVFNDIIIPFSRNVKNLGLHIDTTLGWRAQVTSISQKVIRTLRSLYRLKNMLPSNVKAMLVQTLIFPMVDYGDVCYYDLNADLLNKLDRLLNNCIRFVFNLRKYDHVSAHRTRLKWLPIRQRREERALTTLFSLLDSASSPSYLKSHFKYLNASHDKILRSSHNRLLQCPIHRSDFLHSSFFVQSIILWNSLPKEIRMISNRFTFKLKVREHIHKKLEESSPN